MRLEEIHRRPLGEDEKIFRKAYQMSDGQLWDRPMTYAEYCNYCEAGIVVQAATSHLYKDRSRDGLGTTVGDHDNEFHTRISQHPRYSYPVLHNHAYIEIVYVAAGSCRNLFEDSEFVMKEGDVCIMSPNTYHALSCTNDESCIVNFIVSRKFLDRNLMHVLRGGKVTADFLEKVLYGDSASPYILFPTGNDPWLAELIRRILTESIHRPPAYEYAIDLLSGEFLLHVTREYEMMAVVPNWQTANQNERIVAILGYLSVNYSRTTLADTAAFFGYSASYLSRMIRKCTGKSYNDIVGEYQMERAAELLLKGKQNLSEIAQEVGCYDSSHFNKKFRNHFGVSPGKYTVSLRR